MYYLLTEARAGKANNITQRQEQAHKPIYNIMSALFMSTVFQQQTE